MKCLQIEREIDPVLIPKFSLNNGSKMPCIGFSATEKTDMVGFLVKKFINAGYRYIDCASVYSNETIIGNAIKDIMQNGLVTREQLCVSSKVWYDIHAKIEESCKKSLADLQLGYLDLYLLHWPFSDINTGKFNIAVPNSYNHDHFMYAWRQMERLVACGWVKNIGTSNLNISKLKLLMRDAKIKPVCNQFVMHPKFQRMELFRFCKQNNVQPIASFPLGSLVCQENEKCQFSQDVMKDDVFIKIARRLNATPCQVAIKWAIQRGQIPITSSMAHFYEHIEAVIKVNLTDNDMEIISDLDKKQRKSKNELV